MGSKFLTAMHSPCWASRPRRSHSACYCPFEPWRPLEGQQPGQIVWHLLADAAFSHCVLLKVPAAEEQLVAAEEKFKAEEAAFDAAVAAETVVHTVAAETVPNPREGALRVNPP